MALKQTTGSNAKAKMKLKAYEKELRKLQVELCHLQDWVKDAGACKTRCRDHRAREPSRLSHGGAAGTFGPGKDAIKAAGRNDPVGMAVYPGSAPDLAIYCKKVTIAGSCRYTVAE